MPTTTASPAYGVRAAPLRSLSQTSRAADVERQVSDARLTKTPISVRYGVYMCIPTYHQGCSVHASGMQTSRRYRVSQVFAEAVGAIHMCSMQSMQGHAAAEIPRYICTRYRQHPSAHPMIHPLMPSSRPPSHHAGQLITAG